MFARCVGIPLFFFGVFGNFLTIYIFLIVRSYRQTSCTIYLLAATMAGTMQLLGAIISRILIMGFSYDLTRTSLIWCKCRHFIIATYVPLQLTYECWAIIDQFFATSRNARWRQLSNIKWTRRIAVATAVVWHLHSIPFLIFNEIRRGICIIDNPALQFYWSYIHFSVVLMAFPILVMIIFGILTYRNMHTLKRTAELSNADRQLVIMVGLQVILALVATVPYGSYNVYALITANMMKTSEQVGRDLFIVSVTTMISISHFGGSFYIFLLASKRFRQKFQEYVIHLIIPINKIGPGSAGLTMLGAPNHASHTPS